MRAFAYSSDLTLDVFRLAYLCCECGVCSVIACPMGISPMHVNKWLKKELSQKGLRYESGNEQRGPRADRNMRLIPSKNVLRRLGISNYDHYAGYKKFDSTKVQEVRLPLKQHVGNPAVPKVKTGDPKHNKRYSNNSNSHSEYGIIHQIFSRNSSIKTKEKCSQIGKIDKNNIYQTKNNCPQYTFQLLHSYQNKMKSFIHKSFYLFNK